MLHSLSYNAPPIKPQTPHSHIQLCLVNTDVPAGVGAPPLDTTKNQDAQGDSKDLARCSSLQAQ